MVGSNNYGSAVLLSFCRTATLFKFMSNQVYIISALRSPLCRGKSDGALSTVHPVDLASSVITKIVDETKIQKEDVEDLIVGCATACSEQGGNIGRNIARKALNNSVPGMQLSRWCGSGLEAIDIAACKVSSGNYDLILAGGVESMSRVQMGADMLPFAGNLSNIFKILSMGTKVITVTFPEGIELVPMGTSGELIAQKYGLSRKELDEFSYFSHMKAAKAKDNGHFEKEITPIQTEKGLVTSDEGIRANTTPEKMAQLKPAFKIDGVVTAGNSSQITDGAAFVLLANETACKRYGLQPRAKIVASHVIGSDPKLQLTGPINLIPKVLKKANLSLNDIDLFEINEAFASVVLATQTELNIPMQKINVNGGAIALGHPLGASGARLIVTILHELERRNLNKGLVALCIGGGQAIGMIIERTKC